jgi:branched-chain amino acid aminotransferase
MIYVNGRVLSPLEARIDPADRGFTLADGLFETLRAYRGRPFRLNAHFDRLKRAADELDMLLPIDGTMLADAVAELLAVNRLDNGDATIRITLTRGTGPRGLAPPPDTKPTLVITATAYAALPDTCTAAIVDIRRNEGSPTSRLKTLAYLDNVLAAGEAGRCGAEEAILLNNAGRVACAARANLFALLGDRLVTPPISDGVLPGIARWTVLDIADDLGMAVEERSLPPAELEQAREILLTNSLFEIRSVARLDGRDLSGGDGLAMKLRNAYRALAAQ